MTSPLEGLNIIEFAGGVATRYCGRLFAAHGANVVQVGVPDATGVGYGGAASEAYARWLDHSKARVVSLAAALRQCGGKADLIVAGQDRSAIAAADAVIQQRPGETAVRVGLTWFATDGPYADWVGSDAIIQAMSAIAYATGAKDGAPMLPRGHAPQVVAGATAFVAGLSAVIGRGAGWQGRQIDLNILDANLCFTESGAAAVALTGDRSVRRGINRFSTFPGGIYQAADGWIGVTALTVPQWIALCEMIGRPDLATDKDLWVTLQRMERADELDRVLAPAFKTRNAHEWLEEGQKRRIPLAPVPSLAELVETPHWQQRGSFAPVPETSGAVGPTMPFHIQPLPQHRAAEPVKKVAADLPLAGIRVLDLSMGWAGPLAARHFADLGAEVVKVESCAHFDWWRAFDGPLDGDPPPYETRPSFLMVNRNKRGITLDLKHKSGKDLVRQLAAKSDILIENYAPGVLDKLGIGSSELVTAKPDLIYVGMGAFGAKGPWRGFRAYGSTVEQASGLPFANGEADDPPTMQHVAYGDPVAGIYGAAAALIGLYNRNRTGAGAVIDLGQVECLFQLGADAIIAQSGRGDPLQRDGNRHPLAPLRMVVAGDADANWFAVTVETAAQWNALARIVGRSDLMVETTNVGSLKPQESAMEAAVQVWSRDRLVAEATSLLQRAGVSAGPVHSALDLLSDPQLKSSDFWRRTDRRFIGSHVAPHAPYTLDGRRPPLRSAAPTLGEHNTEVLGDDLGLSPADIARLETESVIGTRAVAKAVE
ncbi:CoA transferase [Bradyrhizobium japonicum]|uniref:CaiB/BaiF CoA-transferase family protein n=1 Tax=Bradyrhizobium japonicum TaxID=375 RepID=UPI001BAB8272|nr:CoA transferase [Bradyrhizobium japonicum]MBR0750276.1 CoA transferase [Bradyrhizobium japonicum]